MVYRSLLLLRYLTRHSVYCCQTIDFVCALILPTLSLFETVWKCSIAFVWLLIHVRTLVNLYPPFWSTMAHSNAHTHTTIHNLHVTHKYACIFMHTTPHTGWILSSPYCKHNGSWQYCGDSPSGWDYSRPAEQGVHLSLTIKDHFCVQVYV